MVENSSEMILFGIGGVSRDEYLWNGEKVLNCVWLIDNRSISILNRLHYWCICTKIALTTTKQVLSTFWSCLPFLRGYTNTKGLDNVKVIWMHYYSITLRLRYSYCDRFSQSIILACTNKAIIMLVEIIILSACIGVMAPTTRNPWSLQNVTFVPHKKS